MLWDLASRRRVSYSCNLRLAALCWSLGDIMVYLGWIVATVGTKGVSNGTGGWMGGDDLSYSLKIRLNAVARGLGSAVSCSSFDVS